MDDKPSQALRHGRWKSSMWKAIEAVKAGEADACVSAGNTGALMAMSKFCLRTMATIERPAIAAIWPTLRGESVVLDVGATIGADAHQLIDFAILGAAMSRALFEHRAADASACSMSASRRSRARKRSRRPAACCARRTLTSMNYHGFVEGDDIGKGTVDVVVTEGFAGNIALKTAEGTARQIARISARRDEPHADGQDRLCLRQGRLRPPAREDGSRASANGGVFLGLNGIVVKSHGGTDAEGFAAAIELGYDMVRNRLLDRIEADLDLFHARHPQAASAAAGIADPENE